MSEHNADKERAAADLGDIHTLRRHPSFQRYFQRRLGEMIEAARVKVLEGEQREPVTMSRRDLDQLEYQSLKRIGALLDEDESANRAILAD